MDTKLKNYLWLVMLVVIATVLFCAIDFVGVTTKTISPLIAIPLVVISLFIGRRYTWSLFHHHIRRKREESK